MIIVSCIFIAAVGMRITHTRAVIVPIQSSDLQVTSEVRISARVRIRRVPVWKMTPRSNQVNGNDIVSGSEFLTW